MEEPCPNCPHPPKARLRLGTRKQRTLDYCTAPFLKDSRHRQMRISYSPSTRSLMPRHVPSVYYRKTCRQIATPVTACTFPLPNFRPLRLASECIATKACTSSIQGNSIGLLKERPHMLLHEGACTFPLPSELYRVRFAHGTPTTLSWRGKLTI